MRIFLSILSALFLSMTICGAQVQSGETVPDIRYPVGGHRSLSRLSNDDVLFTILAFEDESESRKNIPIWYTDEAIRPYFQNYNPDYGRALMVISSMKDKKRIEKKLGVSSYPEYVLIGPERRILTRSDKAEDIIEYVSANLSIFAETDWEAYILKANDLFKAGQQFAARKIVADFLRHAKWQDSFPPEVHKAIPLIVATMEHDDMYTFFVAEIKHRYNKGILSEEDVAPFRNDFSRIHIMGDKDNNPVQE